jgi:hypothetical protein
VPTSVKAATIGLAVKGASTGGFLAFLPMAIGPLIGVLGGIFGTRAGIRATQTPRERRFMIRVSIAATIYVLVALAILFALIGQSRHWSGPMVIATQVGFWAVYLTILPISIIVLNRRHQQIRREEGLPAVMPPPVISGAHRAWGLIGATVGAVAWMFVFALLARDWLTAGVMCAVVNLFIGLAFYVLHGKPAAAMSRYLLIHNTLLGILTAVVVNLRLYIWIAAINHTTPAEVRARIPLWAVNVMVFVIWLGIQGAALGSIWVQNRQARGASQPTN